jgi:hypothetical protein
MSGPYKLKWTYDEETGKTLFRLGKKGCYFDGEPTETAIADAEMLLRGAKKVRTG